MMPFLNATKRHHAIRIASKRTKKILYCRMKQVAGFFITMPPLPITPTGETRQWVEMESKKSFSFARALCDEDRRDLNVYINRFKFKYDRLVEGDMDPFEAWSSTLPDGN
jgi:hypothetical protein